MKLLALSLLVLLLTACDRVPQDQTQILQADTLKGAALLQATNANTAVILCHGKGKHPRYKVVEPLRHAIYQQLNLTTLSIQMPVLATDNWQSYADTFPNAVYRIDQAIEFLQRQGIKNIYIMGHSMGSRMVSHYAAEQNSPLVKGFIVTGCRNNGGNPLSCKDNFKTVTLPVLDIWGTSNHKDQKAGTERANLISEHYQQQPIDDAQHSFPDHEAQLQTLVIDWLKTQIRTHD